MNNLANKEKNLNSLIEKLSGLSKSYAHDSKGLERLTVERDKFLKERNQLEKKHDDLLMEHNYLKNKLAKLEEELNKKSELELKGENGFKYAMENLSRKNNLKQLVNVISNIQT